MKFTILSRQMAESEIYMKDMVLTENQNYAVISIYTPGDKQANVVPQGKCKGILPIAFHDCDDVNLEYDIFPMTRADAGKIIDFITYVKDIIEHIVVHCDAGICRSSGTAMALSLWLNNGNDSGIGDDRRYMPNIHVKTMILSVLRERELI